MRAVNASFVSFIVLMGCCCPLWQGKADPKPGDKQDAAGNVPQVQQPGELFASIKQSLAEGRTTDVDIVGIHAKNYPYREAPAEGAVLIGLQTSHEIAFNKQIVKAVRPLFLTKNGETMGNWIGKNNPIDPITTKAKDGYIVGSIEIRTAIFIEGYRLRFVRLKDSRLDLNDTYSGPWIGGQGAKLSTIGGAGVLSVGICGYRGATHEPCALGLIAAPLPNN